MYKHYVYGDIVIDEHCSANNTMIDHYIATANNGRIYRGDYSWAGVAHKLSMLGFTCRHKSGGLLVQRLFCQESAYDGLDWLIRSMQCVK